MKLCYWMYCGPAHIGVLRVTSSFKNVHAIMHAPLGDDYFNVMRSMLERDRDFTPVTASLVDRHVLARGSGEKVVENITRKDKEEVPHLVVLTPTCTSSILQEDLQMYVDKAKKEAKSDVLLSNVNHYRVNELQAADRTLEQIVRFYLDPVKNLLLKDSSNNLDKKTLVGNQTLEYETTRIKYGFQRTEKPSVNIIGIFTLGFHHQHDCSELKRLLNDLGISVNCILPEGAEIHQLAEVLPKAWFNVIPYREVGLMTAIYLEKEFQMPYIDITPMGLVKTADWIRKIYQLLIEIEPKIPKKSQQKLAGYEMAGPITTETFENYIKLQSASISRAAWFSRSIDCQGLISKKCMVFGDATHAACMTQILVREMGIHVLCAGTYCKHDADWFREQVWGYCDEILISDDHDHVSDVIKRISPDALFGTQMERHIGKRLDIPCGVISSPVHIQNFPLGYRPFLGYEGTNQIADLVYNSFTLGMEDHLLQIFEGGHDTSIQSPSYSYTKEAQDELKRIPGFVRSKVQRQIEKYASQNNISEITLAVMYDAKEAAAK